MISKWQEIKVEFFVSEILSRYWNLEETTLGKVIEIQFFPALICDEPWRRIFIGEGIKPWKSYNIKEDEASKIILKNQGVEGLKHFEDNVTISLLMTGDPETPIRVASFVNEKRNPDSYKLLLINLGYNFPGIDQKCRLYYWFETDEDGDYKFDYDNITEDRKIRIRTIDLPDFEKIIMNYKKTGKFKESFLKDDANVEDYK